MPINEIFAGKTFYRKKSTSAAFNAALVGDIFAVLLSTKALQIVYLYKMAGTRSATMQQYLCLFLSNISTVEIAP